MAPLFPTTPMKPVLILLVFNSDTSFLYYLRMKAIVCSPWSTSLPMHMNSSSMCLAKSPSQLSLDSQKKDVNRERWHSCVPKLSNFLLPMIIRSLDILSRLRRALMLC